MRIFINFILKYYIFFLILLYFSCSQTFKTTTKKNFAYIYNPSSTSLHPEFIVYHKNDSSSLLMIKFYPGELLFNQANDQILYQSEIQFNYKLFNKETKLLEDSSTINIMLDLDEAREEMVTYIPFKAKYGNDYILQIISTDLKRKSQHRTAIDINKKDKFNSQNFLIRNFSNNAPIFNSRIDSTKYFCIEYSKSKIDSLIVNYFKNDFNYPVQPSIDISITDKFNNPDTQYVYFLADTNHFKLNKKGLYIFKVDTNKLNGINISYFGEDFPYFKKAEDMVYPLKYILNDNEFEYMLNTPNKKLAVDEFWLKAANKNVEIARDLVRIYYNRAFLANYYFTSYKEGWKTDRGMIYLVYGLPDYIYKSDNTERWIYENTQTKDKIYFKFDKIPHSYADNHYVLIRSETIQTKWKEAVESWRKGRPFTLN